MTPKEFLDKCAANGRRACHDGVEYALAHPTMVDVWDNCPRADWLIWIMRRLGLSYDRELRHLAADFASRALARVDNPDPRSVEAVRVARLFADGMATEDELEAAREAAWDAAWESSAALEKYLAVMAAKATADASVDRSAVLAANWSADSAARYAAWAARAAAAEAEEDEQVEQARMLRAVIPNPFKGE